MDGAEGQPDAASPSRPSMLVDWADNLNMLSWFEDQNQRECLARALKHVLIGLNSLLDTGLDVVDKLCHVILLSQPRHGVGELSNKFHNVPWKGSVARGPLETHRRRRPTPPTMAQRGRGAMRT